MRRAALASLLLLFLFTSCSSFTAPQPTATATPSPSLTATNTLTPTQTATATPPPTPTAETVLLTAAVWEREPRAPVILYHRFLPDTYPESTPTKTRLGDFRQHLQSLYDAGYSLVALEDWLDGNIETPPGRRPLIFTIDDAYFADQLFLEEDGTPSQRCGIGVLWQFSMEHPDFGFSAALFSNMGDKLYANIQTPTWFIVGDGWEEALGRSIAWGIEHNAMPYNHFYTHPSLEITDAAHIQVEMRQNDDAVRLFLEKAGRSDLIPRLQNIVALPYSIWPPSEGAKQLLLDYLDPAGQPVRAVLEANYFYDEKTLPFIYSPEFDPYKIPRITTNTFRSIDYLVQNKDNFPALQECTLQPAVLSRQDEPAYLADLIAATIAAGECPPGYYKVNGLFFDATSMPVTVLSQLTGE